MNTTTNTTVPKQGTSIDEALGQTELGGWISQNKAPVLSALALIVLGIFGYGIFNHFQTQKHQDYANRLHILVTEKLGPYREGKLTSDELVKNFETEWKEMGSFEGAAPFIIQVVDALTGKKQYAQAYQIISEADARIKNPQLSYFFNIRAAALAEDLGKKKEAIAHLKKVVGGGVKYFEGKLYLDLGRLYRDSGDKEKAKSSFEYVIEKGKEAEFKKMARLYLEELQAQ